ncbi:MAG: hypothetical protein ABJR46_07760 [Tateyamaria sp.]|uniref:hypothetical protein n=1 Tax=Tateyamaria sp. TaxID=1929288 RepID=UPI00329EDC8C
MEEFWNTVQPLLSTLWGALVGITMAVVDFVFGLVAKYMEVPMVDIEFYNLIQEHENITTAVFLVLFYKLISGLGSKEKTVIVSTPAPSTTSPTTTTAPRTTSSNNDRPTPASCSHTWDFTHKGYDKNFPRGHYRCSRCDVHGIEENYGDGRIIAQR